VRLRTRLVYAGRAIVGAVAVALTAMLALGGEWSAWNIGASLLILAAISATVSGVLKWVAGPLPERIEALVESVSSTEPGRIPGTTDPDLGSVSRALQLREEMRSAREQQIAADLERVREVISASPAGVLVTDERGRIEMVNPSLEHFFEVRYPCVGSRPIEAVDVAEIQLIVEEVLDRGETASRALAHGELDVEIHALPMSKGVLVLVRDISEFRRQERARSDFIANVSHELRTPIAAVNGYADALLADREGLDPFVAQMVEVIERNGRRLHRLFEGLLRLYRVEARAAELPVELQLLGPTLQEAVVTAVDQANERKQSFTTTCPPDLRAVFNTEALIAIVGNLAANASNYTPEEGAITVTASEESNEFVRIDVTDNGVGIDQAHLRRVFERFYRIDDARTGGKGTGIGLAIVKHLAEASGLRISVESTRGKGSTFSVFLPRQQR